MVECQGYLLPQLANNLGILAQVRQHLADKLGRGVDGGERKGELHDGCIVAPPTGLTLKPASVSTPRGMCLPILDGDVKI